MNERFARALGALRREKGISQRQAARDLGVSQALLSHYENGIREPTFEFLLRAADYFGCSVDYLLGRSNDRGGAFVPAGNEPEEPADKAEQRRLFDSIAMLDALIAESENAALARQASNYLKLCVYRLARMITAGGEDRTGYFRLDARSAAALSATMTAVTEARLTAAAGESSPELCAGGFEAEYIHCWRALTSVVTEVETAAEQFVKNSLVYGAEETI